MSAFERNEGNKVDRLGTGRIFSQCGGSFDKNTYQLHLFGPNFSKSGNKQKQLTTRVIFVSYSFRLKPIIKWAWPIVGAVTHASRLRTLYPRPYERQRCAYAEP